MNNHVLISSSFFSGDTLGGHLDDMEADWSKPIVSMRYFNISPHYSVRVHSFLLQNVKKKDKEKLTYFWWFIISIQFGLQSHFSFGRQVQGGPTISNVSPKR